MQHAWDDEVCARRLQLLLNDALESDRARLLACAAPSSGSWLHAWSEPQIQLLGN